MTKTRALLIVVVLFVARHVDSFGNEDCVDRYNALNAPSTPVAAARAALSARFNETCRDDGACAVTADHETPTTTRNYFSLLGDAYTDLDAACRATHAGNSVCLASSEIDGGTARTIEAHKPVCVPAACSVERTDHVRLVDPTPGNCAPRDPDCEIVSTTVECPVTRGEPEHDDAACRSEAERASRNYRLTSLTQRLSRTVTRACLGVLFQEQQQDDDFGLCTVSTTVEAEVRNDYSDFWRDGASGSRASFENACARSGGSTCTLSAVFVNRESASFLDLNSYFVFTNYPVCLPEDCSSRSEEDDDESALEDLAWNVFRDRAQCSSVVGSCDRTVTGLSCPGLGQAEEDRPVTSRPSPRWTSPPSSYVLVSLATPTESPTMAPSPVAITDAPAPPTDESPSSSSSSSLPRVEDDGRTDATSDGTSGRILFGVRSGGGGRAVVLLSLAYVSWPLVVRGCWWWRR